MNSIRALNVRSRIEAIPGGRPNTGRDGSAGRSYIAPYNPEAQLVSTEPGTASNSQHQSKPLNK
jgi:hypothetical protein